MQNILELGNHLFDQLTILSSVVLGFVTGKTLTCATDGEALIVQKRTNLPNHQHILALVVATVTPSLYRIQLWEFLFPVT